MPLPTLPNATQSSSLSPRTLVVVAHPDLNASRVNAAWLRALKDAPDIAVHDLYAHYPDWRIDVPVEQGLLSRHDRIILQFPFQWYNCTPLLKLWLDDVLAQGWAYGTGTGGALTGKELGLAVSTWSKAAVYQPHAPYGRTMEELTSPFEVTARRVGMRYLSGFFLNGVGEVGDEALARSADAYVAHLRNAESLVQ